MTKGSHLYVIFDRISNVAETKVIESMNDCVAVAGFIQFLDKDNVAADEHKLIHIGELDEDKGIISENYYTVCTGDKAQETFDNLKRDLISKNEEE